MAEAPSPAARPLAPPQVVQVEVRQGDARPLLYEVPDAGFLVGSVPGCDLRLSGELPPLICLIAQRPGGAAVRKLAPGDIVLVNGRPQSACRLVNGDRIAVGCVVLTVRAIFSSAGVGDAASADAPRDPAPVHELAARERRLDEQTQDLEADRVLWYRRREEIENEARLLEEAQRELMEARNGFQRQEEALAGERERMARERQEFERQGAELAAHRDQLRSVREDLAGSRQELHERYSERRDRLAGLHEAVNRAAAKVQERKRLLERDAQKAALRLREADQRMADALARAEDLRRREVNLDAQAAAHDQEIAAARQTLEDERAVLEAARVELTESRRNLEAEHQGQLRQLAAHQKSLQADRAKYEADLVRLDRATAALEERQEQLEEGAREHDERREQLQNAERDLKERARQVYQHQASLDAQAAELKRTAQEQDEANRSQAQRCAEAEQRHRAQSAECQAWESQLAEDRQELDRCRLQLQTEVADLERARGALDGRQQQLQERAEEVDARYRQMQADSRDLEEQATGLQARQSALEAQAETLAAHQAEWEPRAVDLDRRLAAVEEQQSALAVLRGRVEQMREELREGEESLVRQRRRQDEREADLERRNQETEQGRVALEADQQAWADERRRMQDHRGLIEAALARLRELQDRLAAEDSQLQQRDLALQARAAQQVEHEGLLQAKTRQVAETQERLAAERQALREREAALVEAEAARSALQDQLRRRGEELDANLRRFAERDARQVEAAADLEVRRLELARQRQQFDAEVNEGRTEAEARRASVACEEARLAQREASWQQQVKRLQAAGRRFAARRKQLVNDRRTYEADRRQAADRAVALRREFDLMRQEAAELQRRLEETDAPARGALEHLGTLRDQLRDHLGQLHAYARQSQEDLEALRAEVQAEADHVRQQGLVVHRSREEHRLAVAAFRQQLIEWQGQIGLMKRTLRHGEQSLERRQALVEETTARFARQAEQLQVQERAVSEQRDEVEHHLDDMREWYRCKLRELSQNQRSTVVGTAADHDEIDEGDRQLGELLRSLGLVEPETLTALLAEAGAQRRTLRQVLLQSGALTLYQLALIEAGNLGGLILGPVRVLDRLRVSPHETVYRVFDPRPQGAGGVAILRLLADAEADHGGRPSEFREHFAAALAVRHANVASTYEVFELKGRPAALQEWVVGVAAAEWPGLAAVPSVWLRLTRQAAEGVQAIHAAGLVHGRLDASRVLLTPAGVVKLCGLGEPRWLTYRSTPLATFTPEEPSAATDLAELGKMAAGWTGGSASRRKRQRLPPALASFVRQLAGETGYRTASELLEELARVEADVPIHPEAWKRLLDWAGGDGSKAGGLLESA